MYEYTMMNNKTREEDIYYGYNNNDVYHRNNLNMNEWIIIRKDYID